LVSGDRGGVKAALLGLCWGIGHTLALVVVGAVLLVLRAEMPASISNLFELVVAVMLIGLGVRAVYQAARPGGNGPAHAHPRPPTSTGASSTRTTPARRPCTSARGRWRGGR